MCDGVLFADYRGQAHDHKGQLGLHVLVGVRGELLDHRKNVLCDGSLAPGLRQLRAEGLDLGGGRPAYFALVVLEEVREGGHQLVQCQLLSHGLLELQI